MDTKPITFENLPEAVYTLGRKVDFLTNLLTTLTSQQSQVTNDKWIDIDELCRYLPSKPAKTTVYGWVQRREIPFTRQGKHLLFQKSCIDLWLAEKATKTTAELAEEAQSHTTRMRGRGRRTA